MQERKMLKVSVVMTVIGLIFLYFYAQEVDLKEVQKVDEGMVDETIKLFGQIKKINIAEKATFIELTNVEKIGDTKVVLFSEEELFLKEGDYVEISGKVEEYNNQQEIIANKIVIK